MNQVVLEVKKIHKTFGGVSVLKGVDFNIQKGEIRALAGENGAGKSTLIKIISGVYTRGSGFLHLEGKEMSSANPRDTMDARTRVIHQGINMAQTLTVTEDIFLGSYPTRHGTIDRKRLYKNTRKMMEILGDSIDMKQKVFKVSITEQQMIKTAKAVSVEPEVLVVDEPTATLNDQETRDLFELLESLKKRGVSVIYITHRFSETCRLADHVTVLRDGESVATLTKAKVGDDLLVRLVVDGGKAARCIRREARKGGEIFRIEGLSAGGSLNNIRLSIRRGEIAVAFGLVGADQTELCRVIFGDLPRIKGTLLLDGKKVHINNVQDTCREGIGYVSDDRKNGEIIPLLSIQENICIPSHPRKLFNQSGSIKRETAKQTARLYYNKLHVKSSGLGQKIDSLSGGNQQKEMICRWLTNNVELLILNMPARDVDVGARTEIYRALKDLADQGATVLVVSPEMQEVLTLAGVVYVIHEGVITGEVEGKGITQEELMKLTLDID